MKNYKSIAAFSKQCQRISASVLDDFLISYVASQKKFSRIIKKSRKYKHIFQELQPELPELFITQLLAHQIFKENGMIRSLLNHRAVKDSTPEEYELSLIHI